MSQPGQPLGKLLGIVYRLRIVGEEVAQNIDGLFQSFFVRDNLAFPLPGQPGRPSRLAVHVPLKFQVIGQNEVMQGFLVSLQLRGVFCLIQRSSYIIGFDISDGQISSLDCIVGSAAAHPLGLIYRSYILIQAFYQILQGRPVGVLRGIAGLQSLFYLG